MFQELKGYSRLKIAQTKAELGMKLYRKKSGKTRLLNWKMIIKIRKLSEHTRITYKSWNKCSKEVNKIFNSIDC